ncbi:MAG TPA: hypothetical protein VFT50_17725 [Baekduia sp.]|nr:hypothetical protein [Baekduia sp.]
MLGSCAVGLAFDPREALIGDPAGVVSIYLCPRRSRERALVRAKLGLVTERARSWPAADRRALRRRLPAMQRQLADAMERAEAAGAPGVAAFFGVASGTFREVPVSVPVSCSVSVDAHARVGQLIRAAQASAPVGLLEVHRDGVRALEVRGDLPPVAPLVGGEDWEFALLSGLDGRRAEACGANTVRVTEPLLTPGEQLSAAAREAIFLERRRRQCRLLDEVVAEVSHGGAAVAGLAAVERTLASGTVEVLLVTDPAPSPVATLGWPRRAERLVRLACEQGVTTVVLAEWTASRAPRGFEGVAARVR